MDGCRNDNGKLSNNYTHDTTLPCYIFSPCLFVIHTISYITFVTAGRVKDGTASGSGMCVCVFVCVFVCEFSSHSFWTSSSLDVPAGVTQEEGHTGFFIHLPSACLNYSREKDSAILFPRRP